MWKKLWLLMIGLFLFITPSYATLKIQCNEYIEIGTENTIATVEGVEGNVRWTSSDSTIAQIDSNGKIKTGSKGGNVTITATVSGETASKNVFVWNVKLIGKFYYYNSNNTMMGVIGSGYIYIGEREDGGRFKILDYASNVKIGEYKNKPPKGYYLTEDNGFNTDRMKKYYKFSSKYGKTEELEAEEEIEEIEEIDEGIIQRFSANIKQDGTKFVLSGNAYLALVPKTVKDESCWEVVYENEKGEAEIAIRAEGSDQYYTEETYYKEEGERVPVNIIFSNDMSTDVTGIADGYIALEEETNPEVVTGYCFNQYEINIDFPLEVSYNGELTSTITLEGITKEFESIEAVTEWKDSMGDTNITWELPEIELSGISVAAYDEERDEYYVPIIVEAGGTYIECKFIIDISKMNFTCTEPVAKNWDTIKTNYTWVMKNEGVLSQNSSIVELSDKAIDFTAEVEDYKDEYKAGDTIKIKGKACKHLLKSTMTELKLVYELIYGPWTKYYSYMQGSSNYKYKRYATPPEGSITKRTKVYHHWCDNGNPQYRVTYYYSAPEKKMVHDTEITTSDIGELICPVDITFTGFRVTDSEENSGISKVHIKDGKVYIKYNGTDTILENENARKYIALVNDFTTGNEADWSGVFTIDNLSDSEVIKEQKYDAARGLHYGIVTVECDGQKQEFKIYFGMPNLSSYSVTYKTEPADIELTYPGIVPNDQVDVKEGTNISAWVSNTNVNLGNSRYAFSGWEFEYFKIDEKDATTESKKTANYSFNMPAANVIATAKFENVSEYTLTVAASPEEGGTVGPDNKLSYSEKYNIGQIKAGQECELIPNANEKDGWSFVGWTIYDSDGIAVQPIKYNNPDKSEDSTEVDSTKPGTAIIKMPESDVIATAHFKDGYTVTFIAGEGGTIGELEKTEYQEKYSINKIKEGTTVNLPKANPEDSYEFFIWEIEPEGSTTSIKDVSYEIITGEGTFFMPMDNVTAKAIFKPKAETEETIYTLDVIATPPGYGTVGPNKVSTYQKKFTESEINEGITEVLTAEVNSGYEFRRPIWSISEYDSEGVLQSQYTKDDNNIEFAMPLNNVVATAWFTDEPSGYRVTFEANPSGAGKVPSDLSAVAVGEHVKLTVEAYSGYEFTGWSFEKSDGTEVYIQIKTKTNASGENVEYFEMPEFDVVAVANFKKTGDEGEYTLYVTAMTGGTAWTDGNENHPKSSVIEVTEGLPEGQIMYKIEKVKAGEKFEIEYKITEKGYEFKHWKYKPILEDTENVNNNTIKVTMPDSDLTVTAVFKNDKEPDSGENPKIKVTSSNIAWGRAWTVINKEKTSMDKTYDAEAYKEYTIYFEANSGYYFTGWEYTTTVSPFISGITKTAGGDGEFKAGYATIRMPNVKYLEIMGIFSPKPENIGNDVTFSAVPKEGGKVPENLENVEAGTRVELSVTVNSGYEFDGWVFKDENGKTLNIEIKTETYKDENGDEITIEYFIMPDYDVDVIAQFNKEGGEYTLYVTAMTGGTAWTDGNENHPKSSVIQITEGLPEGQIMYKVEKARAGEKFEIEFETYDEYTFSNWEYRVKNLQTEEVELKYDGDRIVSGKVIITMPSSDLTVTAIFKDDAKRDNPWLKVTSNNIELGSAWAKISDSANTEMSKKYDADDGVVPGKRYELYYKVDKGYFTGWRYSTTENPLIWSNGKLYVEMPTSNLEVMAMFSPSPDGEGYKVKFKAEPAEGGKVPTDLSNVEEGTKVELTATPNNGYELEKWVFKDDNGRFIEDIEIKKNPITGTEYFIMPDLNVTAIAVFTDNAPPKVITIIIQGEGTVTSDGVDIPSGGTITGKPGDNKPINATPATDWIFEYWASGDGDILSTDPNYIYTIEDDATIIAVFKKKGPYTLYVTSYYGGDAWISEILEKNGPYDYNIEDIGPDNLGKYMYKIANVYAGDKFKIEYSVTEGNYQFGFWEYKPFIKPYKESGNTIEITMPASDLTVTAVFKNDEIKEKPELSVTTNNPEWGTAWTVINNVPTVVDQKYTDVVIGEKYTMYYKAEEGYYFVNWNYSTTETPFIADDVIVMPNKDLEIMAMFAPIPPKGDGGHKITFKAEPPEGGKVPDDTDLENILPGGKVTIAVSVNQGWEFDYWRFENSAGEDVYPKVEYDLVTGTGYFIMPDYDIVAIAVFKKASDADKKYTLSVTANPEYAGRVNIEEYNAIEIQITKNTEVTVKAVPNSNYEFMYWYIIKDGKKVRLSDEEKYTFIMPGEDRELIAWFKKPGKNEVVEEQLYDLTVSVDPAEGGKAIIKGVDGTIRKDIAAGTSCTVSVTVNEKTVVGNKIVSYSFDGWYDSTDPVNPVSTSLTYTFSMESRDVDLIACLSTITGDKPITDIEENPTDSFRIVSVRDLKWKNYFTTSTGSLTGKYFTVPQTDTTILDTAYDEKGRSYTQPIKMGYAVEFELDTISVPYDTAYIEITPKFVDKHGNSIDSSRIFYGEKELSKVASYFLEPITIYADKRDATKNNAYTSFMAEAIKKDKYYNGQYLDFITWRWLYYLPAQTSISKLKDDEITVSFDIKVKSTEATTIKGNNQVDVVTDYRANKKYSWSGKAFTYSLKESLLDDIYDNAQN